MSKKNQRKVSSTQSIQNGSTRPTEEKVMAPSVRLMTDTDFNPDYTNVKKDLKRIGILAVSFFAILVILSFFLH